MKFDSWIILKLFINFSASESEYSYKIHPDKKHCLYISRNTNVLAISKNDLVPEMRTEKVLNLYLVNWIVPLHIKACPVMPLVCTHKA